MFRFNDAGVCVTNKMFRFDENKNETTTLESYNKKIV